MIDNTVPVSHAGINGSKCYVDGAPEKRAEVMIIVSTKVGWSTLGLITRDWSIGDSKVVASDRM